MPVMSHSRLDSIRRCPRQYRYKYVDNIVPVGEELALKRGKWLHSILQADALKRGLEKGTLLQVPDDLEIPGTDTPAALIKNEEGFWLVPGAEPDAPEYPLSWRGMLAYLVEQTYEWLPDEVKDDLTEGGQTLPDACRNIMRGYLWQYRATLPTESPLLVESHWTREDEGHGTRVNYKGRLDLLYRNEQGRVVLRDWKTTKSFPGREFRLLEGQRLLYAWGAALMLHELGIERVDAVEFDFLLTKTPTKPSQNQPKKPKKPTKANPEPEQPTPNELIGELSKAKIDTTPIVYYDALKEYGLELTQEHKDKLAELDRDSKFYDRQPLPVSHTAIVTMMSENAQLAQVARQIDKAPGVAWRNASKTCGRYCDYVELCAAEFFGADTTTIRAREFEARTPDPEEAS